MKSSDVEKAIAMRNGIASGNSIGESLVDANAKKVFKGVVSYTDTPIGATEGAVESDPYRSLVNQSSRTDRSVARDALHQLLDEVLAEEERKTSKARDSQAARGGGCGRIFTCDRGALDSKSFIELGKVNRVH